MAEDIKKTKNEDIKSGKGLKPIPPPKPKESGITTEQRNKKSSGVRNDRFSRDTNKEKSNGK
jgi:hypothetical protein